MKTSSSSSCLDPMAALEAKSNSLNPMAALEAESSNVPDPMAALEVECGSKSKLENTPAVDSSNAQLEVMPVAITKSVVTALPRLPQHGKDIIISSDSESSSVSSPYRKQWLCDVRLTKNERKNQDRRSNNNPQEDRKIEDEQDGAESSDHDDGEMGEQTTYLGPLERYVLRQGEIAENVKLDRRKR